MLIGPWEDAHRASTWPSPGFPHRKSYIIIAQVQQQSSLQPVFRLASCMQVQHAFITASPPPPRHRAVPSPTRPSANHLHTHVHPRPSKLPWSCNSGQLLVFLHLHSCADVENITEMKPYRTEPFETGYFSLGMMSLRSTRAAACINSSSLFIAGLYYSRLWWTTVGLIIHLLKDNSGLTILTFG